MLVQRKALRFGGLPVMAGATSTEPKEPDEGPGKYGADVPPLVYAYEIR